MRRTIDVLVVDDDIGQGELIKLMMKDLGLSHRIHHTTGGQKALDFLYRRSPYDHAPRPQMILLDLNMPGMDGHQVLRLIKIDPELSSIPVIVLSSSQSLTEIDACYGEHANAYIQKSTDLESSLSMIQELDRFWTGVVALPY